MANDFEQAAEAMGITLSSTPPSSMTEANNEPTEDSTVENTNSETEEVLEETETSTQEADADEAVTETEEVVEVPVEAEKPLEASANEEEEVITASDEPVEEELSDEEYEKMVFDTVAEMVGVDSLDRESLMEKLTVAPPTEVAPLDERVQVIADFVAETGRDPQDWFTYMSMNPSEMDDSAVLKQSLQDKYPDLSSEDAMLLLDSKYKVDPDLNSEQDVRLGALQLKMDASNARKELELVRSKYKEPVMAAAPIVESSEDTTPFDASWMSANESVVNDMEAIEFTVGKDKSFNFGLTDAYKASLKQTNANMGDHFNQYIDKDGNWNHEKLSVHTAILDNIESIVDSAYKQGVSSGTSNVVKQAVNPSSVDPTSTNSTTASSSQDKVRQQILNALQGGDDTLRLKF